MFLLQRIAGLIAAAVLGAGSVLSCCSEALALIPTPHSSAMEAAQSAPVAGMEGCEEDATPAPDHDPNCAGGPECFAAPNAKSLTLAASAVVAADAPHVITFSWPIVPENEPVRSARRRITPPANGPPPAATPVSLKDILRI